MLFARKAFDPADVESADEDVGIENCKPNGMGKTKASDRAHGSGVDETDDDLSEFIVPDDQDDDSRPVSNKCWGKRRANIVLDSDDEDDYDDVIIGAENDTTATIATPSMSEHEISTKMKVCLVVILEIHVFT
jgi:hypothetical protein